MVFVQNKGKTVKFYIVCHPKKKNYCNIRYYPNIASNKHPVGFTTFQTFIKKSLSTRHDSLVVGNRYAKIHFAMWGKNEFVNVVKRRKAGKYRSLL